MYTTNEEGLLNVYAVEPAISYQEYPAPYEQQRYLVRGAIALLFVTLTVFTAFAVS